ncbi:TPA: fimbria/pilus periplasmic chaperone, partial [Escherichia coli]|nr:fimbria/pilus periplasmic chaperone [Escherichia coli]
MNVIKVFFFFFCTLTPFFTYSSNGGISLSQTRVIFSSNKDSASIYVKNTSSNDVWLLRGWVTSFESDEKDDSFVITPPLYRLDPERNIQLRINVTDKNKFPKDVESVYYLNVMAIPPQMEKDPSARENTNISFSINNRIKLFHRPESINNRKLLAESYKKITVQQRGGHV